MPSISYSSSVSLHYTTASARHARMPSRQEAVEKESESTASSSGPRQGSSTNVQGAKQAGYPYSGTLWDLERATSRRHAALRLEEADRVRGSASAPSSSNTPR
ncbi:hypothetical protein BGX23_012723 [Mortierella sp. AD031]|nr:hypothetical protein BGX23_012723 [Mortierella sp. AD031]